MSVFCAVLAERKLTILTEFFQKTQQKCVVLYEIWHVRYVYMFGFQVSRTWKVLAEDEVLWYRLCQQEGYLLDVSISDRPCWKLALKDCRAKERALRTNWKVKGRDWLNGIQMLEKNGNLVQTSGGEKLVFWIAASFGWLKGESC